MIIEFGHCARDWPMNIDSEQQYSFKLSYDNATWYCMDQECSDSAKYISGQVFD